MNLDTLRTLITRIASCLVRYPNLILVQPMTTSRSIIVTIDGHRDDIGKLMGKQCRNVKAIEAIVNAVPQHRRVRVNIAEGYTGDKLAPIDIRTDPNWTEAKDKEGAEHLADVCASIFQESNLTWQSTATHTVYTICITPEPCKELEAALHTVMKAWGGMRGRFVTVELAGGFAADGHPYPVREGQTT